MVTPTVKTIGKDIRVPLDTLWILLKFHDRTNAHKTLGKEP